jgi:hypothetical protein
MPRDAATASLHLDSDPARGLFFRHHLCSAPHRRWVRLPRQGRSSDLSPFRPHCCCCSQDDQAITALQLSAKYNLCPVIERILRLLESDNSSTHEQAATSVSIGEAVNSRDRRGFRALHYAAQSDSVNAGQTTFSVSFPASDLTESFVSSPSAAPSLRPALNQQPSPDLPSHRCLSSLSRSVESHHR